MTTGYISEYGEVVVPIDIFDQRGRLRRVEAIVDTGFDYFLALPIPLIQSLGLAWVGRRRMRVATDQMERFESFAAEVWWFGARLPIRVLQTQSEILVGTRLLWESQLTVQLWQGGSVTVQAREQ